MYLIGKDQFVIETYAPAGKAINKTVIDENTGEKITVPSGEQQYEWLWFCGVGLHPSSIQSAPVWGNVWSPYPEQAAMYKNKDEAEAVNKQILGPTAGGIVSTWECCHKAEGRQIIIPVDASIMAGKSKSGIDGEGKL